MPRFNIICIIAIENFENYNNVFYISLFQEPFLKYFNFALM